MVSIPYPCPVPSTGAMARLLESFGEPILTDSLLPYSSFFNEAPFISDFFPRFVATPDDPLIPFRPRLRKLPLATPLFPTLAANEEEDDVVADRRDFVLGSAKRTNLYLEHCLASGIFCRRLRMVGLE